MCISLQLYSRHFEVLSLTILVVHPLIPKVIIKGFPKSDGIKMLYCICMYVLLCHFVSVHFICMYID